MIIVTFIIIIILIIGHYGLPERINENEFQLDPESNSIIKGGEPFLLNGTSNIAFLLIHGFEGTPFTLKPLGEMLHKQGHTVIAPLLPGHGTNVKEFSKTRYKHWYKTERIHQGLEWKTIPEFKKKYSRDFLNQEIFQSKNIGA